MTRYISLAVLWSLVFAGMGAALSKFVVKVRSAGPKTFGPLLLSIALLSVGVSPGLATDWYVDADLGSDSNSGTSGSPFETIQKGVDSAGTFDRVWVKGHSWIHTYADFEIVNKNDLTVASSSGTPVIDSGNLGIDVRDSDDIEISGFTLDGNGASALGLRIIDSADVTVSNVTVDSYDQKGVRVEDVQRCTFTSCTIKNTIRQNSPAAEDGTGVLVVGTTTDDITFTSCSFLDNDWDGIQCNAGSQSMSDITLTNCVCKRNGRQGFRTQRVETVRVTGGDFNDNDASGIQIESETSDVIIDDVWAADNSEGAASGESGIWVHEASGVTIKNSLCEKNPWNIIVSQSDDVTIDNCDIEDAEVKGLTGRAGIVVGTGANYFDFTGNPPYSPVSGADWYSGMPKGGVRDLTIKNCYFSGNGSKDILYGDSRQSEDDADYMEFTNNKLIGTWPSVDSVEFDLGNGVDGFGTNLEDLQDNP